MEMSNISMAVVYPTNIVVVPQDYMPVDTPMHKVISAQVDGHFDSVYHSDRSHNFVGFVNDEGLLTGMEPNTLASAIFGRFLCGPCVIVGTVNEHGVNDGESYNITRNDLEHIMWHAQAALMWQENLPNKLEEESV